MCVGVKLINDELGFRHPRPLSELSFSAVRSCCNNYCLTNLASDQDLQ